MRKNINAEESKTNIESIRNYQNWTYQNHEVAALRELEAHVIQKYMEDEKKSMKFIVGNKSLAVDLEDANSPEVQVALLTDRIKHLTGHMQTHKKDFHSRHGLLVLVGRRRRLLNYLKSKSVERYTNLIQKLELRR